LRLIRLHPLVIVGAIVGLLCFILDPYSDLFEKYGTGQTILMFLSSCFMIPYPVVAERSFNLFHLNPPSWSLFWEYIANIAYALVIVKINNKALWITTFVAALLLLYECRAAGYLGVGWGGGNFAGGAIRVFYSFTAGILVYRSKWRIESNLGFIAVSILLLAAFFVPFKTFQINRLVDAAIVMFYFPFLVALGAGAKLRPAFTEICKWSGEISYPLYMLHYGFMWIFLSYMEKNKPINGHLALIIPVCTILLILFSQLLLVYVDKPIRKALKI
jgi:peptidoglycan/LPS O-acetylase OafA/YrhL